MNITRTITLFLTLLFCRGVGVFAQDAQTVVKNLETTMAKVADKTVDVEMILENLNTKKIETKNAVLMQKGSNMKLFRYTAPKSDAGIATLSLPNNEIYVYLPMFKNPKKMTNLAESNAFNKSDFSISDMSTSGYADNYNLTLLAKEVDYFKIELVPKDLKSEYGKLVMQINKTNFYPERIDYFDKKMVLIKVAEYHHINQQSVWVAEKVTMKNVKTNHQTTLKMSNFKLNQGLSDDIFRVENMVSIDKQK